MEMVFEVTLKSNIENKKLKDPSLTGECIKVETVALPSKDESTGETKADIMILCHVIWTGKMPYHPAVKAYRSEELVLLSKSTQVDMLIDDLAELRDDLSELQSDVDALQEVLFEDDEDGETKEANA